ncbi:MAG TPA: hypothetical protein PKW80_03840 [Bacteroidales bacterium]|nr:hypothetical protein [Bacteroidales bacterium]
MKISDNLFWDVDVNSIDYKKHASFIVQRVLESGTLEDFFAIRDFYGKPRLKQIIKKLRYLDERTLSFCSIYFKIKPEDFRCYTLNQLNQSHWNC